MNNKGLETRTIVLLVVGLIILALILSLVYLTRGHGDDAIRLGLCKGELQTWCVTSDDGDTWTNSDCAGKKIGDVTFCGEGKECHYDNCDTSPEGYVTCCNAI